MYIYIYNWNVAGYLGIDMMQQFWPGKSGAEKFQDAVVG